jgi:hypothetical protein
MLGAIRHITLAVLIGILEVRTILACALALALALTCILALAILLALSHVVADAILIGVHKL